MRKILKNILETQTFKSEEGYTYRFDNVDYENENLDLIFFDAYVKLPKQGQSYIGVIFKSDIAKYIGNLEKYFSQTIDYEIRQIYVDNLFSVTEAQDIFFNKEDFEKVFNKLTSSNRTFKIYIEDKNENEIGKIYFDLKFHKLQYIDIPKFVYYDSDTAILSFFIPISVSNFRYVNMAGVGTKKITINNVRAFAYRLSEFLYSDTDFLETVQRALEPIMDEINYSNVDLVIEPEILEIDGISEIDKISGNYISIDTAFKKFTNFDPSTAL